MQAAQIASRTDIILSIVPWLGRAVLIAAAYIPLQAIQPMVNELAGKHTDVTLSISISVVINFLLGGTYFIQKRKLKRQHDELVRLRGRLEEIDESRLSALGPKSQAGRR